jgi:hypothetical protein
MCGVNPHSEVDARVPYAADLAKIALATYKIDPRRSYLVLYRAVDKLDLGLIKLLCLNAL